MEEIVCHNCNQPGHYARYCHLPRDMSRVICDLCHQPGHFARNCFSNPTSTYARTIPRNPPYNSYPYTRPPMPVRPPNRPPTTPPSRRILPPINPRPVNHIETSPSWEDPYEPPYVDPYSDPYSDPYQNPWEDYEEYTPYHDGTYHIRPTEGDQNYPASLFGQNYADHHVLI
jgi:hypothetical protein